MNKEISVCWPAWLDATSSATKGTPAIILHGLDGWVQPCGVFGDTLEDLPSEQRVVQHALWQARSHLQIRIICKLGFIQNSLILLVKIGLCSEFLYEL